MSPTKRNCLRHVLQLFVFAFTVVQAKKNIIRIPVSINPIVQEPSIKISHPARYFYKMDREFYSRVTVLDAARNEKKDLSEIIKNKIGVLFLITASSHVSGSLTVNNLIYPNSNNKWSYQIPVQHIIHESNGTLTRLTDKIPIYKIQELAMKVLERKYGFSVSGVLKKLRLKPMEFYGVDERQWINVVGFITEYVIKDRSNNLNLTPCYLAELINKTEDEMKKFTLNEVDMYLYNISLLMEKLPVYRNATISSLYETFNITATQLARMSNVKEQVINTMGLKNLLQLLNITILKEFGVLPLSYEPKAETEVPCRSEWDSFRRKVVQKAYENEARAMSIRSETLASVIHISKKDINTFSFHKMMHTLKTVIQPIKDDKRVIENYTLSMLKNIHGSRSLNTNKRNAISLMKSVTNFSKHQLKLLYDWTMHDFHFARLFSVAEVARECTLNITNYSLLLLARINIGEINPGVKCQSFAALRLIWGQASLNNLKEIFKLQTSVPLDKPIVAAVSQLTNSSTKITNRVLSNTPMIRWLLTKITLNNISALTSYTTDYLKEAPFQRIMVIVHEMHNAGSFDATINLAIVNYSSKVVLISIKNESQPVTEKEIMRQNGPTALPRSSSTKHSPDLALKVIAIVAFIQYITAPSQ